MTELNEQEQGAKPAPLCQGFVSRGPITRRCLKAVASRAQVGCVHEHVRILDLCTDHLTKKIDCQLCFKAGHNCVLVIRPQASVAEPLEQP